MKPVIIAIALAFPVACHQRASNTRHVVYVIDVTGSVPTDVRTAAIATLDGAFRTLHRGDALSVLPITGDTAIDASRHALRFELGIKREPYDADLRRLAREGDSQLQELLRFAQDHPFAQSDILGTLGLAAEEMDQRGAMLRAIVVLSDLVQDDGQYDFKFDPQLTNAAKAKVLAQQLTRGSEHRFAAAEVLLGSLPSSDLARIGHARRDAIRTFWVEWFERQGAQVQWATDGLGEVRHLLNREPSEQRRSNTIR